MTSQRHIVLSLAIIFGLFSLAMTVALVATHVRETRQGVLNEKVIPSLKAHLNTQPGNEKDKEEIRRLDLQLREEYFFNRSRFNWAAWMLLGSLPLALLFARLFMKLAPEEIRPLSREEMQVRAGLRKSDKARAIFGLYALGGLCLIVFVYEGLLRSPVLPPMVSPGKLATGATTSTLVAGAGKTGTPVATATTSTQVPGAASPAIAAADTWPNFRGPGNIGVAGEGKWPAEWSVAGSAASGASSSTAPSVDKNIIWKTEIPISGNSSPIVWGNRVFLTGATKQEHDVMCFDGDTGKLLWTTRLTPSPAAAQAEIPEQAGFASSTPATDGKYVYAIFATGVLGAVDFQGKIVWQKDQGIPKSMYGFASSLLMVDGSLFLQFDQGSEAEEGLSELRAIDPATGNLKWSMPRSVPNSWASPALIETKGRKEIITCGSPLVIAYDPASGKELWTAKGLSGDVAPSPAFGGGLVFTTNDSAQLMAIRPGGSGDVSATHIAWTSDQGMPDTCSPVSDGKYLLQEGSGGYLTCFNVADGKLLWEQRLESAGTASPIVAGGKVYLCGEDGVTRIFQLGEKFQISSQGQVGEAVSATPAFARSRIFIRGAKHLFCVGEKK